MQTLTNPREVLEVDAHGKHIVWRRGNYFIAVDDPADATYITLWCEGVRGNVGHLRLTIGREHQTRRYASVANVMVDKRHCGQRLGLELYRMALRFVGDDYAGIASEGSGRANRYQVPKIWRRLGALEIEDTFLLSRAPQV